MQSQRTALACHLEEVLAGKASLEALLRSPGPLSGVIEPCVHGLHHFLADQDIRAKDPEYRRMQENEMATLIRLLHEGASEGQLAKVSFLGVSESRP
jgi:hypothetical protein